MRRILGTVFFFAALLAVPAFGAEDSAPSSGASSDAVQGAKDSQKTTAHAEEAAAPIENFSLRDHHGKVHSLADYADKKLVVVAFVGCECPVAKMVMPRLQNMSKEFADRGVAFLAVDSNSQDSLSMLAKFVADHCVEFPVLKDPGNVVADKFHAERTPEIVVLDRERRVRYRGRVDDQYQVGLKRPHATRDDLKLAIGELLDDKPVSVAETAAVGCHICRMPAPIASADGSAPAVTYSEQVSRLFQDRCLLCHRDGQLAPMPLTTYEEVVGWGETIREVVEQKRMPPWPANPAYGRFANDCHLSDAEKQTLFAWLDAGSPEGDRAKLPPPRAFVAGWQIDKPDLIVYATDEPVDLPAEGVLKYRHYVVDPGFKEDKWIRAAECKPGNVSVVHHMVVNFAPPGVKPRVGAAGQMVGYAPGLPPVRMRDGYAMFVPAGSKIIFQMHYTPNGSPQRDRSALGLVFADPATVTKRVDGGAAINVTFEIPPGADDVEVQSKYRFREPMLLLSLMPHMHLRGKAFRFEAQYSSGEREILLDVPRYDFNWQLRYELAEPKMLPADTQLVCTGHFDNSPKNLANPDPQATVHWGEQTWDEMMIGYFGAVSLEDRAAVAAAKEKLELSNDPDSQQAAREILERGLTAFGGEERLKEQAYVSHKTRGAVYIGSAPLPFSGSIAMDPTHNRYRLAVTGLGLNITLVLDDKIGWLKNNGSVIELPGEGVEEFRERMHTESVALVYPVLADNRYQLFLIKDARVGDKSVDGVLVRRESHRDVRLLFDRESHLLVKTITDIWETGKDVTQETLLKDYSDVNGVQRPRKTIVRWNGADRTTRENLDYQTAPSPDAAAFAKP